MSDQYLIESFERYFNGEMLPEEKAYFEKMRSENAELDQMAVAHKAFMQQLSAYADRKSIKETIHQTHHHLLKNGTIAEGGNKITKGKVIQIWHRYKKTMGIAACIAGITALIISGGINIVAPTNNTELQNLSRDIEQIKKTQDYQSSKLKEVTKIPAGAVVTSGGSAFMIDGSGYLITNAHVLKGSSAIVANSEGQEFKTVIAYINHAKDLAVLKITDTDFKTEKKLPYDLKKEKVDLGSEVFTLGYPRNDITYNKGYLSAQYGYDGDTSTVQIALLANPGNSGGPVFNKYGDIVGILSTREANAQGVTFAIKSSEIYQMLENWRNSDTSAIAKVSIPEKNNLKGVNRIDQIKRLEKYVYIVKAYN